MKQEKKEECTRVAIKMDKATHDKSLVLRTKYSMNISSLCRNMICDMYDKLEGSKETK